MQGANCTIIFHQSSWLLFSFSSNRLYWEHFFLKGSFVFTGWL